MFLSAASVALVFSSLLGLSTRASALCLACSNSLYDYLPNGEAVGLNYWTCSGTTITCYYPSTEYPGTYTACEFTSSDPVTSDVIEFTLTATSPSVCDNRYIGDNSKCQPSNNPWNVGLGCTAAEAYVGEINSALL